MRNAIRLALLVALVLGSAKFSFAALEDSSGEPGAARPPAMPAWHAPMQGMLEILTQSGAVIPMTTAMKEDVSPQSIQDNVSLIASIMADLGADRKALSEEALFKLRASAAEVKKAMGSQLSAHQITVFDQAQRLLNSWGNEARQARLTSFARDEAAKLAPASKPDDASAEIFFASEDEAIDYLSAAARKGDVVKIVTPTPFSSRLGSALGKANDRGAHATWRHGKAAQSARPVQPPTPGKVHLPIDTAVRLKTLSSVSTAHSQTGDRLELEVLNDVIAAGKVLIKAGAKAVGSVVEVVLPSRPNHPGKISIRADRVTAVDGTSVLLHALERTRLADRSGETKTTAAVVGMMTLGAGLLILGAKGPHATISSGSVVNASTDADAEIAPGN